MATISITNRGLMKAFLMNKYVIPVDSSITLDSSEASVVMTNALELQQEEQPGDPRFSLVNTADGKVVISNITKGKNKDLVQFHVPKILLKPSSVTDVDEDTLAELYRDKDGRTHFESMRGQPDGVTLQLPNKPPFNEVV